MKTKKQRFLNYIGVQYHTDPNINLQMVDATTGETLDPEIKCGITVVDSETTDIGRFTELGRTKAPIGWVMLKVYESPSRKFMFRIENSFKALCEQLRCTTNGLTEYYRLPVETAVKFYENWGLVDVTEEFTDSNDDAVAIKVRNKSKSNDKARLEMEERYKDTGLFTNPQAACIAYNFNNVDHKNFDASIEKPFDKMNDVSFFKQKKGSKIVFYHNGRLNDNEDFLDMIDVLGTEMGVEPNPDTGRQYNNSKESYFKFDSEKEGLKMFGKLKSQGFKPMNT